MRISAVIPAYNAGRFLSATLESVLSQTLPVCEIIVVDDGSTDETAHIAQLRGATAVRQANAGPAVARNTGIQAASGDWIALLDADDRWFPEKLERQSRLADNADIVYGGLMIVREPDGSRLPAPALAASSLWPTLLYRNPISPSTVLARRDLLLRIPFTPGRGGCEDWDCWVRAYRAGARFANIADPLVYYREAPGSVSSSAERMLTDFQHILEPTLLAGMRGWARWCWRKRIVASQLYSAALIERARRNLRGEYKYLFRSLLEWPSPLFRGERFKALAHTVFRQAGMPTAPGTGNLQT